MYCDVWSFFLIQGTMRVLLVMLHDFPEFLCDYHYAFCDVIPPNCIQVRNLILSAFPRNMRLPDPFTPNLKVDNLPEIANAPRIVTNFCSMIQPPSLRKVRVLMGDVPIWCWQCVIFKVFFVHNMWWFNEFLLYFLVFCECNLGFGLLSAYEITSDLLIWVAQQVTG